MEDTKTHASIDEENNNTAKSKETINKADELQKGLKEKLLLIASNLIKKIEKLPDNHPLKKEATSVINEAKSSDSLFPPPLVPKMVEKNSLMELQKKLGPEKWTKYTQKIKKT